MTNEEAAKIQETYVKKQQDYIQTIIDKWTPLFQIGSWQFSVELKEKGNLQFRYNCQNGSVVLEITYEESIKPDVEKLVVSMLVDFSLIHTLLPKLKESGDQYIDHDDRNIKHIMAALLELSARQEEKNHG